MLSHMYPTAAAPLSGIFVRKQAAALRAAGVDLTMIHPTPWAPRLFPPHTRYGRLARLPALEYEAGMPVYHPRAPELPRNLLFPWTPLGYRLTLAPVLRRLWRDGRPDVLHAHVAHPDGAAAVAFGREWDVPVVVTVHGQDFAQTLRGHPRAARSVRETLAQAAAVILVSDKLRRNYHLEDWADDLSKYHVVYNGIDPADMPAAAAPPPSPLGRAEGPAEDWASGPAEGAAADWASGPTEGAASDWASGRAEGPLLFTLAYLRPPKGHRFVLEAMAALREQYPDLRYRIAGDGAERGRLEALSAELGLAGRVEFLGELPNAEALRQLAQADIYVMPSWDEAFGIAYLEAMALAKPLVATAGDGIGDIIARERTGLVVPPRDSAAVAAALRALLADPAAARAMGERGRALVRDRFTWARNARATIAVYEKAAARKARERASA
ncbi:MAG: glycosyltransferase [Gracilibacteraceae bacterium]|nr:glycosyltransferase [Gracilibacteraceae bacterium]